MTDELIRTLKKNKHNLEAEEIEALRILAKTKCRKIIDDGCPGIHYDRQNEPSKINVSFGRPWHYPPAILRFNKKAWNGVTTTYVLTEFLTLLYHYLVVHSVAMASTIATTSYASILSYSSFILSAASLLLYMTSFTGRRQLGVWAVGQGFLKMIIDSFLYFAFVIAAEPFEKRALFDLFMTLYFSQMMRFVFLCCYVHHGLRFELFHRRKMAHVS